MGAHRTDPTRIQQRPITRAQRKTLRPKQLKTCFISTKRNLKSPLKESDKSSIMKQVENRGHTSDPFTEGRRTHTRGPYELQKPKILPKCSPEYLALSWPCIPFKGALEGNLGPFQILGNPKLLPARTC